MHFIFELQAPKKYVDAMIQFYISYREHIIATFTSKSKTLFEGALDKVNVDGHY